LGKLPDDEGYVVASETCALDSVGAKFVRDIEPGEIIVIDENGIESIKTHCGGKSSMCVFEFIYFARPDSVIEGASVHKARLRAGHFLAKEHPCEADVVIGCPDSGLDAALGFSQESGIPYGVGFVKNRYIGRTFIQPTQSMRENSVNIKLNVVEETVRGKRVVVVDDSMVRGTTSAKVVKLLRAAGAKEIHMRFSAPPFISECYFGTDVDSKENLIANKHTVDEIADIIGVDSLGFLGTDSVLKIAEEAHCGFCRGCFTGKYPIDVPDEIPKDKFEMKIEE
jgi:amidophosphoribosyltransferase